MKIEAEWDHTLYEVSIYLPQEADPRVAKQAQPFYLAWVKNKPPVRHMCKVGKSSESLQAAINDAIRQLEEWLAEGTQPGYTTKASAMSLDLSFLKGL